MNNDLISREALKKNLEELKKSPWYCEHKDTIDGIASRQAQKEALQIVEIIIDNAPTVDLIKNRAYNEGFITAMKLYARPKGEFTDLERKVTADAINYLLGAELLEENGYTEAVTNALKSALQKIGAEENHL